MTIGDPARAGVVADRDATAVARLKGAGAILLGKTNCPPYGGGTETDNPVHGRTSNPYDLARTPGGSSGGEAAIVAAGGSACGLGTDSGASVRLPAHFCGLAAIKPTAGRVPVTGVSTTRGRSARSSDPRTQVGPLARAVADVALLLRLVAGPGRLRRRRRAGRARRPGRRRRRGAARRRVHVDNGLATPTAETVAAVRDAAAALREAGARVEEAAPPGGGHELTLEIWRSYGDEMRAAGPLPGAAPLGRLPRRDARLRRPLRPASSARCSPGPARPHGAMNVPGEIEPTSFTTPASLTGWPAATVRAGTSPEGLPIGVQLVARPWRDDVALAAALAVERALGGYRAPGRGGGPEDRRRPDADRQPVKCGCTATAAQRTALCTSVRGRAPLRKLTRALTVCARPRMIGTDARTTVVPAATRSVRTRRPLTNSVTARIARPVTVTRATREAHCEATATRATRAGDRTTTPATADAGCGAAAAGATVGATGGTASSSSSGGGVVVGGVVVGGGGQCSFLYASGGAYRRPRVAVDDAVRAPECVGTHDVVARQRERDVERRPRARRPRSA